MPLPYLYERYEGKMSNNERQIFDGSRMFRVYNRTKHNIGVKISNGQLSVNIVAGSFVSLSATDILYIDSICAKKRFFSSRMLVPVDETGKDLTLEDLGGFTNIDSGVHLSDEEITENLEKSVNHIKTWIESIEDPVELFQILEVGKSMDLPASKLKILKAKVPEKDLLED